MVGMSVDGLISGLDTTSLISQLMQVEAAPQTAMKARVSTVAATAAAYRSINTRFDAIRSAGDTLMKPETWTAFKATSTATTTTVSASTAATPGSFTFTVNSLASTHSMVSATTWTATTDAYGLTAPIEVFDDLGVGGNYITVGGTGTLADAAAAINASTFGLSASVVKTGTNAYRLQVSAKESGAASVFSLGAPAEYTLTNPGTDAVLDVGGIYQVTSPTNTFTPLDGLTLTVTKADPAAPVTVSVVPDPDAIAAKVSAVVDAANAALSAIKTYSTKIGGATAVLRGDGTLTSLSSQVLVGVSSAVGADGSAGAYGVQLTKDGSITFDKAKFLTELKADPAKVQRVFSGAAATNGVDTVAGTADDVAAVPGLGQRLHALATGASDATTGTLVGLAKGRDSQVEDLQARIVSWDRRLAMRKSNLSRQFAAMETALSGLKSQSTWLSGQIASLPSMNSR